MAGESRIPRLLGDAPATRSLKLLPVDGFVLSRIDGKTSERDLSALTGLPDGQVRSSLEKLEALSVITFAPPPAMAPALAIAESASPARAAVLPGPPPQGAVAPRRPSSPPSQMPGPRGPQASSPALERRASRPPSSPPSGPPERSSEPGPSMLPPAPGGPPTNARVAAAIAAVPDDTPELGEDVDLQLDLRRRVLGMTKVLSALDYYAVLGVERTAEKKEIKRAYFELAALFHPDKYFRKRLGNYKFKMETIFGRVTQAYDTLQAKDGRKEYDLYLADLDRTRGVDDMLRTALAEMEQAEKDALLAAERQSSGPPTPGMAFTPPASGRGASASGLPPPSAVPNVGASGYPAPGSIPAGPAVSEQARRDALAMRLRGRSLRTPGPTPSPLAMQRSAEAVDALKRRYEARVVMAKKAQVDRYVSLAKEADAKGDVVAAANAYRVALTFATEDDPVRATATEVIAKADKQLAEAYVRQAAYEERSEQWEDAAKTWQRVVKARPNDPYALARAAHTMVKAKGDLHEAVQIAQRAIALDPENPDYKITLATVYIAAGLGLNARRELEAAAQLSPRNATIQTLLKQVKAG